jgi:rare lipoprotein A
MRRLLMMLMLAAPAALLAGGAMADRGPREHDRARPAIEEVAYQQIGTASWYGPGFHGRKTASGTRFDQRKLTAAHRKLPLGSEVKVTNLDNGKSVTVKITDRGPHKKGRVIDVSKAAAKRLGMVDDGVTKVRIEATPQQLAMADGK